MPSRPVPPAPARSRSATACFEAKAAKKLNVITVRDGRFAFAAERTATGGGRIGFRRVAVRELFETDCDEVLQRCLTHGRVVHKNRGVVGVQVARAGLDTEDTILPHVAMKVPGAIEENGAVDAHFRKLPQW